jgi:DnaJ-class molecular chaperone
MICSGDGIVEEGRNCPTCGGSGEVEAKFGMTEGHHIFMFNRIVDLEDKINDILDKCNDVLDKCNDIFEKLNE